MAGTVGRGSEVKNRTMNELQLMMQERTNTGTAWTRNEKFDKDGYLMVKIFGI